MKVLLIIPAYNEEENILRTIASIETFKQEVTHFQHELDYVVINDGSADGTKQILEANQINAIHLVLNLGIGGAVQTGYKYALENEYDVAVQFDGDGQHDINSLPILLEPLAEGKCDFSIGSRFI
ncbi:MAG: glycosyltransferase family 2 protein, partial [Enterococcus faecalis]|nr:glycosyltransferase family 2 protein [Enterococcus faecalis]